MHPAAAQLMNNLSELIMRRPPTPEIRHQAEAWARQAHGLLQRVQETSVPRRGWFSSSTTNEQSREVCDQVLGVVLFNLGMLREVSVFAQCRVKVSDACMVDGRGSCDGAFVVRAESEAVRKDRDEGRRFANQAGFKTGWARCGQLDGGLTCCHPFGDRAESRSIRLFVDAASIHLCQ